MSTMKLQLPLITDNTHISSTISSNRLTQAKLKGISSARCLSPITPVGCLSPDDVDDCTGNNDTNENNGLNDLNIFHLSFDFWDLLFILRLSICYLFIEICNLFCIFLFFQLLSLVTLRVLPEVCLCSYNKLWSG